MQAHQGCNVYVAEIDGQVVGTFVLYILPNMTRHGRPAAMLENIVVDEANRGQGIGRVMLEHARDLAQAAGCYKLSLTSNAKRTAAHDFYRRCGMVQHGVSFPVYSVKDSWIELPQQGLQEVVVPSHRDTTTRPDDKAYIVYWAKGRLTCNTPNRLPGNTRNIAE